MPGDRDLDRIKRPDIELGAVVKAKRLRFKQVPETKVSFRGKPDEDSVSGSERENLPDEVEPDVTYRDVRVRWRAAAEIQPSRGARKRRS
jgi:hypothetical protein